MPRHLLTAGEDGVAELFTSPALLAELTDVLSRPKFERKLRALLFSVNDAVDAYLSVVTVIEPQELPRISLDPDDDRVLATALAAKANLIVSGDWHLLSLQAFGAIPILNTAAALAFLRSSS